MSVFEKLDNYDPFGPKKEKVSYFALVNRQFDIFEELYSKMEELKDTNFVLSRIFEVMYLCKF